MFQRRRALTAAPYAALLGGTLFLAGCGEETAVQEAEEEGPAAVAAILGEPVTIEAEVQEVVGPFAFTVGEDDTLILSATEPTVDEGDDVVVTGIVRSFVVADFEQEYDWFDFGDEDWVVDYERDLVVVADAVETAP